MGCLRTRSLATSQRIGDDHFVIRANCVRSEIAWTDCVAIVNAKNVAANASLLIEQVQSERRACAGQIDQQFLKRRTLRLHLAPAAGNVAKHGRDVHPHCHVEYASTLNIRGRPLAISRQDSPRSLVA